MRIIGGSLGGRRLVAPRGEGTRPTADRVKEALFSILGIPRHDDGRKFRVLDLYAGSGSLGLEAVSRGAAEAVLVDQDEDACAAAKKNIAWLGVGDRARVLVTDAGKALRDTSRVGKDFGWVFVDPPYSSGAVDRALRLLGSLPTLSTDDGVAIAEHDRKDSPEERYGKLVRYDRRDYGQTSLSFYRLETVAASVTTDGGGAAGALGSDARARVSETGGTETGDTGAGGSEDP